MQREKDYLKKKIDKLALVLAELLAKVTKTDVACTKEEFANEFDQILKEEKNLTVVTILEMDETDFLKNLKENYQLNANQMYILADLLYEYTKNFEVIGNNLNNKVIVLYENCIIEGVALSLDKYKLIDRLKNK